MPKHEGDQGGRPPHDDDWYRARLDEMRPVLILGNSIRYAAEKSGNESHVWVLYEKYRANDWFAHKVDAWRAMPGEVINNSIISLVYDISDRVRLKQPITDNDVRILKLAAERHRSAQPYFANRIEEAPVEPAEVGKILDKVETDYVQLGFEASKQMVALDAPVQDQKQIGPGGDVQTELPAAQAPGGSSTPPVS